MTDPRNGAPADDLDAMLEDAARAETADMPAVGDDRPRELETLKDQHLRLAAEFDNFRRRSARERQEAGWRAQGELVRSCLDALDDLARFGAVNPDAVDARTVVDGIQLVERKLQKALGGHGFEVVDPTGAPFDPARHEAVSTAPAASAEEDGMVAVCFQAGYVINGVVLRPARVIVKQWAS
jgi:molecular chaperone GrpE